MRSEPEVREVAVGELGEVRMGKQLSPASRAAGHQYPYLRVANVYEGRITYDDVKSMSFAPAERKIYSLQPGDILLNEGQENLGMVGRSAIYEGESGAYCFQNTLIRFRPSEQILPEYAQAVFINWRRQGVFARVAEKTSISHLGGSRFAALPFPVVPLTEQRRIMEVMGAITESERSIEASMGKFWAIRTGLTEKLSTLHMKEFSNVVESGPQNGLYKAASSYGVSGTPIVRINSFSGGPSDFTRSLLRIDASAREISQYAIEYGDVLINRVNTPELVGKSTTVTSLSEPTVFESNIMRCKLDSGRAIPEFAEVWLGTATAKAHFLRRAKSAVSQASINRTDVLTTPFPDLGLAEQEQFLQRLNWVNTRIKADRESLDKLRQLKLGLADDLLGRRVR
ncbi:restriction endonuclease subunit S [Streptomyces sp. NPDC058595]|uniref:restriction endonuclease subunit S n=1 Tax=Streptomyces sp. NPDC058595 TaxID=3346550 RepID=UPI00365272F7